MKRRATMVLLVMAGATAPGCFWKKKPATATAPPPPQRRTVSPKRAPAKKAAAKPKPPARKVEASAEAVQPPAAGSLTEILTPEQRQDLSRELSQSLSSARRGLEAAARRSLTLEQFETMELARSFIAQAERARKSDLSLAAQLARRADLLARALLSATR